MKPIREQCAEKGIEVPVGKTALEIVNMGLEVSPDVELGAVLESDEGCTNIRLGPFPGRTGYCFRSQGASVWQQPLLEQIAQEIDREVLAGMKKTLEGG